MSAQNFKPGDVAMVGTRGEDEEIALCVNGGVISLGATGDEVARWTNAAGMGLWSSVAVARRLVVIDPEDREQVERLYVEYVSAAGVVDNGYVDEMQAALREFANPTPPKPDEPTGHLAVVIDTNGNRWINWRDLRDDMDHERPWVLASDGFTYREYADIAVAEIKWEGIQ